MPHSPPAIKGKPGGTLSGLTFAAKDNYDVAGHITGCGSPDWLASHRPASHTAPTIQALLDGGADLLGKTICDELFYSITGANAHYGTPKNSRAPERMPGGSSSGSVAAVAAGICDFSLGSDTGGSVRAPASFCGLYGLRPSHGRIDLSHAQAMAPSFDTAGWFAADADTFRSIGPILLDGNSHAHTVERVLIGTFAFDHADDQVSLPLGNFLDRAAAALPPCEPLTALPGGLDLDQVREAFRIIQAYEVWQTFGPWVESAKPNLGPGIKERIALAKTVTRAARDEADEYRVQARDEMSNLLVPGTVLCLPTAASPPPRLDVGADELDQFRLKTMALLAPCGIAGLPQISIPGASADGVPVGIGFIGWRGGDEALLDLAVALSPHCVRF